MRVTAAVRSMVQAQRHTVLLWAPVFLGMGIAVYFGQSTEPALWLAGVCGVFGLALLIPTLVFHRFALLALGGFVLLGFCVAKLQSDRVAAPVLSEDYYGPVAGRIVGFDRSATNKLRLMLDQVHLPGIVLAETPRRVRIVLGRAPEDGLLGAGARIMTVARLGPPPPPVEPTGFDFRRHAWFMGLGAIGYTATPVVLEGPPGSAKGALILRLRMTLSDFIRARMPDRTGGFAAAILTGDRSGIDPKDLVDLRASNLAHLLAISGLHMGLMTGAVFVTLRFVLVVLPGVALVYPVKRIAAVGAILAGAAYLAISGASIATQRAFIMATVLFIAVLCDRPALTLRAIALAALIVLLWRPDSLLGAGFQMSFAATIALVAVYAEITRARQNGHLPTAHPALRWAAALLVTSAVAGLATAPFSAFHFNQLTRYGLLANVLAVPAMGLLVMPSVLLAIVLWPLGLEGVGFWLMDMGIAHILHVAHQAAALEGAVIPVASGPPWVLGVIAFGGLITALMRGPARGLGVPVVLAGVLGWGIADRPVVLVDPDGRLIGVRGPEGRVLNKTRGAAFAARVWLENDGDSGDQAMAQSRPAVSREDDVFKVRDASGEITVVLVAKEDARGQACLKNTILILPKTPQRPAGDCVALTAGALVEGGAHAFFEGKLSAPVTTAEVTGDRPWTRTAR
ncbi:MAG: ComEC/Rec2 family competence protein [Pseudomonadota bacterium]